MSDEDGGNVECTRPTCSSTDQSSHTHLCHRTRFHKLLEVNENIMHYFESQINMAIFNNKDSYTTHVY